MVFQENKKCVR